MDLHWQDGLTWAIIAAAAVYVARRVWLSVSRKKAGGCGSCGTCPADSAKAKQSQLVLLEQVTVKPADESRANQR